MAESLSAQPDFWPVDAHSHVMSIHAKNGLCTRGLPRENAKNSFDRAVVKRYYLVEIKNVIPTLSHARKHIFVTDFTVPTRYTRNGRRKGSATLTIFVLTRHCVRGALLK